MKRKVIQIAAVRRSNPDENHIYPSAIFALCNDGTMWSRQFINQDPTKNEWKQIGDIPQPEKKEKKK